MEMRKCQAIYELDGPEIGDHVFIRDDLVGDRHEGGTYVNTRMERYRGREAIITEVLVNSRDENNYKLDIDRGDGIYGTGWIWTKEMFDPYVALEDLPESDVPIDELMR